MKTANKLSLRTNTLKALVVIVITFVACLLKPIAHWVLQGGAGGPLGLWAFGPIFGRTWYFAVIISVLALYPVIARKLYLSAALGFLLIAYEIVMIYSHAESMAVVGLTPQRMITTLWPEFLIWPGAVALAYVVVNVVMHNQHSATKGALSRGFTLVEILVVVAIVAIIAALLLPALSSARHRAKDPVDISNMKQLYVAITLYEEEGFTSPPTLLHLKPFVSSKELFKSPNDQVKQPNPRTHDYPAKPFVPDMAPRSVFRISYAYHRTYPPNDEDESRWADLRSRSDVGILASPWSGWPSDKFNYALPGTYEPDGPPMEGPIMRINMDGSLFVLPHNREHGAVGSTNDFFFYR